MFDVPFRPAAKGSASIGGASLDVGRENERRGARLRESDGEERSCARVDRNGRGVRDIAAGRRDGFLRVVDEDESVEDLVAVGFVVVLDPEDAGRTEVQFGKAPLRGREEHQTAQQCRERHLLAATATRIFHVAKVGCMPPANLTNPLISRSWSH